MMSCARGFKLLSGNSLGSVANSVVQRYTECGTDTTFMFLSGSLIDYS